MNVKRSLVHNPAMSLCMLFGCFFVFLVLFGLVGQWLMPRFDNTLVAMRIMTLMQAIFLFIVPALLMAMTSTRLPATLLGLDRRPPLRAILIILITMAASVPFMNRVIEWNEGLQLPASMASLEEQLKLMEEEARATTSLLLGGTSIGALIVSILIVGVMAGLSEELFFRGALQRVIGSTRVGRHAAVWIAAIVFSFMHFQFYGFVPRLLLGLFFGYLLLWSGCLWLSVIAHAFNNALAVTVTWLGERSASGGLDTLGQSSSQGGEPLLLLLSSVVVTILGIIILRRELMRSVGSELKE